MYLRANTSYKSFMTNISECYTLHNGVKIPCIGFGTYKLEKEKATDIMLTAIRAGYRFFDTASYYGTEIYLADAIKRSGFKREDFFITSKVWKSEMGYQNTLMAFSHTLKNLDTDYLDLYLIHWPRPALDMEWKDICVDTWKAMEELYKTGKVRAIGLSNFLPHHMDVILQNCSVKPMVNQLEIHPGYMQENAVNYSQVNGMLVQAWSPLGRKRVLQASIITELAAKYKASPARICLRYELQKGINPIPKASVMEHMKDNMDVFDFEISIEDMHRLNTLPQIGWSGSHPDYEWGELKDCF